MVYPSEYTIKFYDGSTLMHTSTIYSHSPKEALAEALNEIKGLVSFNKIRIIKLD